MIKLNIRRFKILNLFIIFLLCFALSSCNKRKVPPNVEPIGGYYKVYYTYNTYEEMIAASEKCDDKSYSYLFDFQFEGISEYSYTIQAVLDYEEAEGELTSDATIMEYIITGRFDDEKEFSLYFDIFGDKTTLEAALKDNHLYVWESNPMYDEYDDYVRYFLHRCEYSMSSIPYLSEALFTGPFEDELIQQILEYVHISIFSQKEE